jgi:hypothetical protein
MSESRYITANGIREMHVTINKPIFSISIFSLYIKGKFKQFYPLATYILFFILPQQYFDFFLKKLYLHTLNIIYSTL